jgi:hypothetical protein
MRTVLVRSGGVYSIFPANISGLYFNGAFEVL